MKIGIVSRVVIWLIVFVECVIIFYLSAALVNKYISLSESRKNVAVLHKEQYVLGRTSIFPHFYEPEIDITLNDHPDWLGYNASYSINRDSLNERMEYSIEKPDGVFRVVMLGDSFTYGLLVNTYENYTELLEDKLSGLQCAPRVGFEVINLGVPAYDVGFSAERFRLRGHKYNPDLVVWFFNPFTLEINADRRAELENKFQQLFDESNIWGSAPGQEVTYEPARMAWIESMKEMSREDRIALQAKYFDEFLQEYHGSLVIVANQWETWSKQAQAVIENSLAGRPQTWVYTSLPDLSETDGLLKDKHPNVSGHQQIAAGIFSFLNDNNVLGCE